MPHVIPQDLEKAAVRGEPSHVWRAGQQRRFAMLKEAAGERLQGSVLVDGCGVLEYQARSRLFAVYRTLCDGAVLPEWMEARRKAA